MFDVRQYSDEDGRTPFEEWLASLDRPAALKVTTALARMEHGNLGDVKAVGKGVSKTRVHFGPGYRIYFGKDGEKIIILLGGGTKKRQGRDVADAQVRWNEYKRRKRSQGNATN